MKAVWIPALAFLTLVAAGKFSLPLHQEKRDPSGLNLQRQGLNRDQKVLKSNNGEKPCHDGANDVGETHQTPHLYIKTAGDLLYTTTIALGTPPQSFRALIDLNSADLFVPSIHCTGSHCSSKAKYDSSASSTYHSNGTRVRKTFGPIFAHGNISEDVVTLGGSLEIPGQEFIELDEYEKTYPDWGFDLFDSVLGLTFDKPRLEADPVTPDILPSPFRMIVEQGLLDENVFSILIPKNNTHIGDLMFGGYNEDFLSGELISHPLFPEDTTYWQIEASSLLLVGKDEDENDTPLLYEPLPDFSALLYTTYPGISLPPGVGRKVLSHIPHSQSECTFQTVVDCDSIADLPSLAFGFQGHDVVVKGEHYTLQYTEPNPPFCDHPVEECWLNIDPNTPFDSDDTIILGAAFLKSVYAVFDWDKKTISFGESTE